MAGIMNVCLSCSDATHFIMLKLSSWATIGQKGFKLNLTVHTNDLTITCTKQILCITAGHPSTWNDKTLVLFDPLISNFHCEIFQDNEFYHLNMTWMTKLLELIIEVLSIWLHIQSCDFFLFIKKLKNFALLDCVAMIAKFNLYLISFVILIY